MPSNCSSFAYSCPTRFPQRISKSFLRLLAMLLLRAAFAALWLLQCGTDGCFFYGAFPFFDFCIWCKLQILNELENACELIMDCIVLANCLHHRNVEC